MREPVSNVDLALLRQEKPTNLMVVTGVLILGRPIELEQLRATLEMRLLQFDRFQQRVVNSGSGRGRPCWQRDPDLDLRYHVQRISLPPPGDEVALQAVVSQMISTPLDPNRPLWQFHLVEPYAQGCGVICRVHHSVGDGTALVHVLQAFTDTSPDAPWLAAPGPSRPAPDRKPAKARQPILARSCIGRGVAVKSLRGGLSLVTHPARIVERAETWVQTATELGSLVLPGAEPNTALRGKLGVPKQAAWSEAIPMDRVTLVRRRLGGTVNDVLLAAVGGALRRYLLARGEEVDGVEIRAAIPVSLRSQGTEGALGNHVGAVLLALPICLPDPAERLRVIRQRMDGHKSSLEAPMISAGLKALAALPEAVEAPLVDYFSSRLTAVMTNVPGPRERLYLAGSPVESFMAWVPKTMGIGLGVTILSYAGQVRLGVISDAGLVPDPETIIAGFQAEFDLLLAQAEGVAETVPIRASLSMLDDALLSLDAQLDRRKEGTGEIA